MKRCANCILPETFPGISFNEAGLCNHCQAFKSLGHLNEQKKKYKTKFEILVEQYRNTGEYDCLMAFSGGKDSSFTLLKLKTDYKLNILALTFDNSFISPFAFENIRKVTDKLGIDHIMIKPSYDVFRSIVKACTENEIFSAKTLERASTICTSCIGLVKFISLKIALEKKIPFITYGWSPGQAPISSSIFKNNPSLLKQMQKAIQEPLRKIVGERINNYFLQDSQFELNAFFPYNISPLAFLDYNEEFIIQQIEKLGWRKPTDTDSNSTNCLLNSYANQVHKNRYKFHPYVFEIAKLVREGYLNRDDALLKINQPENPEIIDYVKRKLST